jgi:hypothetical protein
MSSGTYSFFEGAMSKQIHSTSAVPIIEDKLALVYDNSGAILHIHRVTTLQGGKKRSDEEIARAALEHAKRSQYKISGAEVLLVEAHEMKPGHTHRVDVAARALRA